MLCPCGFPLFSRYLLLQVISNVFHHSPAKIDAELPEERRTFIAQDSNAKFVYTLPTLRSALRESSSYPSKDVNNARPEGLAYLLYTSGTTGTPKGCLLTHDGLSQAIMALSSFNVRAGGGKRQWKSARYLAIACKFLIVHTCTCNNILNVEIPSYLIITLVDP